MLGKFGEDRFGDCAEELFQVYAGHAQNRFVIVPIRPHPHATKILLNLLNEPPKKPLILPRPIPKNLHNLPQQLLQPAQPNRHLHRRPTKTKLPEAATGQPHPRVRNQIPRTVRVDILECQAPRGQGVYH